MLTIARYRNLVSDPINKSHYHLLYLGIFLPLIGWCNITVRHMTSVKNWIQITLPSRIPLFSSHINNNSPLSTSIQQYLHLSHPITVVDVPILPRCHLIVFPPQQGLTAIHQPPAATLLMEPLPTPTPPPPQPTIFSLLNTNKAPHPHSSILLPK